MISILHVITGLDTGGAESNLVRLVTRLDRKTFAPSVISLTTAGLRARELADADVPVLGLGMKAGRPAPRALWRLIRAIRRIRPDILQTWLPHADLLGYVCGRAAGVEKICWNVRSAELDPADHPKSLFWVLRILGLLSTGPACIVTNSAAGQRAQEAMGYHPRRWELIPNGFDTVKFAPSAEHRLALRRRLGLSDDVPLVGLVARYHPMKDHRTFVEAASLVAQAMPDARFLMVGRGIGADNRDLAEHLTRRDLGAATFLEPDCADTAQVFPALDVAVSSSYSEAFPNVVGEAMACGVPCVVTDAGDSAKLVGDTGIVVAPREAVALADAMLRLLSDAGVRAQLGRAARARITSEYSVETMVARYDVLYRDLAGRPPAAPLHSICVE